MRATKDGETSSPMFLMKLWKLVEDKETDDLISWSNHNGSCTFTIRNQVRFAKEILPLYFKHSNMASFIRQLNMYGFRKMASLDQGALRVEKDDIEFYHVYFSRDNKSLLQLIKRKITMGKATEEAKPSTESLLHVLNDVSSLYTKQESVNTQLSNMKRENEALWREVATLRQQHMKQQQIVAKMVEFLLNVVRPNCSLSPSKRKVPLMLDEAPHKESKLPRLSRAFSYDATKSSDMKTSNYGIPSSSGPVIHDITDTFNAEDFLRGTESKPVETPVNVPQPQQPTNPSENDKTPKTLEDVVATTLNDPVFSTTNLSPVFDELYNALADVEFQPSENLALASISDFENRSSDIIANPTDFSDHVSSSQLKLDHLKDIISNGNHNLDLDFSSLFSRFFPDNELSLAGGSNLDELTKISGNEIVGNELIQYNPSSQELGNEALSLFSEDILSENQLFENIEAVNEEDNNLAGSKSNENII